MRAQPDDLNQTEIPEMFNISSARVDLKKRAHPELVAMHEHSFRNRSEVIVSTECFCFSCLKRFPSCEILTWWDPVNESSDGMTAVCTHCSLDAVFGDQCRRELSEYFLVRMHQFWFDNGVMFDLAR